MSKRIFEEDYECPNIVIVPTLEFPAKKPKLDAFRAPLLPPGVEYVQLEDIPVPPLPPPISIPQEIPPNNKQMCESGKIDIKTKVYSEKLIKKTMASSATFYSEDNFTDKASGSEVQKYELDRSKIPPNRSWASNYLMSIGQSSIKPIKISLSTRRTSSSIKEAPENNENNTSSSKAGENNKDVETKKIELLEKKQPAKDNPQTTNRTEQITFGTTRKSENHLVNNNSHNISDTLTSANHFIITNSSHALGPMEQFAPKNLPILAPLNADDIDYYNYNITNNFTPTLHRPITDHTSSSMDHNIDHYHYYAHNINFENTTHENYQLPPHFYKSHYSTDQVANNKSYLDIKIDEFLAKVSRDTTCNNRFDDTKTDKEIILKKSLSLKCHATDTSLKPRREIYQEDQQAELNKKMRYSKDISEKYTDFNQYRRKATVSSKSCLEDGQEENKIKANLKNYIIKENYKYGHEYKRHKEEMYESKKSVGNPKRPASAYKYTEEDDYYNYNKKYDLNKAENDGKMRRSDSKSERDSRSQSSRKSEEDRYNDKTKREDEEKPSSSYSSRRSEEHKDKKIKTIQEDIEKPSTSYSSRRSAEHEYIKSKTKQEDKEKKSSKNKEKTSKENSYEYLKEMIRQKIKKAKDELKGLQRQENEKTFNEIKPKKSDIDKSITSKQANDFNTEKSGSDKSVKSIVQANNNNPKLHNIDEHFDLRSILSRQNSNQYFNNIRDQSKTYEKAPEKPKSLVITVANDCSDNALQVDKPEEKPEKSTRKIKNKKVKKIQLVINVVCEESDTSESEDNTAVKENEKCSSFNAEDLSFLDDLNIDEIVNSLTSNQKELDVSEISANNITTNIEEYIISDDDSDASTVHLEEVDQTHIFDDYNQIGKAEYDEKEHKNIIRDLVNNNVSLAERRSKEDCIDNIEHKIHENCELALVKKIKQELSDNTNCTLKKTENIPVETTSYEKIDKTAKFKRLFIPMMEIKAEPIEILSDDETSKNDNIDITNLVDHALETAAQDKTKLRESKMNASVTKTSTTVLTKTKPDNIVPYVVPTISMGIKSELNEIEEKMASITNSSPNLNVPKENNASVPRNLNEISHSQVKIKEEPKEIAYKAETSIDPNLKMNIPKQTTKPLSSTSNILKHNALSNLAIKAEADETNYNKEVYLQKNTKLNASKKYTKTIQSKKDISSKIEKKIKNAHYNNGGESKYLDETKNSNGETNKTSEHAITDLVRNKGTTNIGALAQSVKGKNKESDKKVTDIVHATCEISNKNHDKDATIEIGNFAESVPHVSEDLFECKKDNSIKIKKVATTTKYDLLKSHHLEIQKDIDKMYKASNIKGYENPIEVPFSLTKDALDTDISSKKINPANMKLSLLPTPKPSGLLPTPKPSSLLSTPKNFSPASIPKMLLSTPKVSSPTCMSKNSTAPKSPLNTPKPPSLFLTPKTSNLSPAPKSFSPANTKISSPGNTKAPAPISLSPANNPDIKDANDGKALRPAEQVFVEVNLKKRMQECLKTHYDIAEILHRGKFSKIFKCCDETGKEMVVKLLRHKCDRYNMGVMKEQMLEKLQRDIPEENLHFIRLYDGFSVSSQWSFLMEYYPKNLNQALVESARPFHIDVVQQLSRQLATAVAALRNHNIVHSDIKPGHVLLNSTNNRLKLCGFDEASYGERNLLPNIGTVNYRAPEIILGYSAGFSIDVWSTALVMYEMATKRQLFPGTYNNDILFKQICTLGFVPIDMIRLSRFAHKHFNGATFMKRSGEKGKDITFKSASQMHKNNKLLGTLWGVYHSEWGAEATRRQKQQDLAKVYQFCHLLQQMLLIHPKHRLPIEFTYGSHFLLQI